MAWVLSVYVGWRDCKGNGVSVECVWGGGREAPSSSLLPPLFILFPLSSLLPPSSFLPPPFLLFTPSLLPTFSFPGPSPPSSLPPCSSLLPYSSFLPPPPSCIPVGPGRGLSEPELQTGRPSQGRSRHSPAVSQAKSQPCLSTVQS
eukprot:2625090-Rhodomonas_salina.1